MADFSVNTTALDFDTIKAALKTHLAAQTEFADYDFEAAGLSNLLDVLAYNTHYNGLIANFALNESYISTAQLRPSMVGLAESLGYIPGSVTGAQAVVTMSLNLSSVAGRAATYSIPSGSTFTSSIDGTSYTFQTLETLTAADNGSGIYNFKNISDSTSITLTEGTSKTKSFIVGANEQNTVYVIPDTELDKSTVSVKVYRSINSAAFDTYTNALTATSINSSSNVYFIKESPNGYFEISFGDGTTFGTQPEVGNKIVVSYLQSNGISGNGGEVFTPSFTVDVLGTGYTPTVTTTTASNGGAAKEGIESMRKNAPYRFAAQNRMVTSEDYSTIILRDFSSYISDIRSYGGEDATEPKYGTVYVSLLFNTGVVAATQTNVKNQIRTLVGRLAVASFNVEFIDPTTTYIGVRTFFQYNPAESASSQSVLEEEVNTVVSNYFSSNLGLFDQSFRRSNMLTLIDDSNTTILSSRADITMIQRIEPTLSASNEFSLTFPGAIAGADDQLYRVTSSYFSIGGDTCYIRNKLNTTKLEVFNVTDNEVVVDNLGSYDPTNGTVTITGWEPETILAGVSYVKIIVTPANQSAVTPTLNNVLNIDANESFSTGVQTTASN